MPSRSALKTCDADRKLHLPVRMRVFLFGLTVTAVVIACAAPPIPNDSLDDSVAPASSSKKPGSRPDGGYGPTPTYVDGGEAPSDPAPPDAGTGTSTDAGTSTPNPCASSATKQSCYACCDGAVPAALPVLQQAYGQCACELPGLCAGDCAAEYCAGAPTTPGGDCDTCLFISDALCTNLANDACNGDPSCSPLFACDSASGCAGKP